MTLDAALPLLVAIPILAAGITAFARARRPWTVVVLLLVQTAQLVAATLLVIETADGSVHAHQVGGWIPGIAIPFAVDAFSALMLTVAGGLILVCTLFALQVDAGRHRFYAPLVMVLQAGVVGTLLTADVFNMFVFIEVMLLPTYGLLVLAARGRGTRASVVGSRLYVTFNLFVSTLFLAGVAMIYGTAGTVNLGELAGAASEDPLVAAAAGVSLFALSMKAAVVPVHGWLARAYPSTSPAITALISGLHTKVAIYAIYRLYAVIFEGDERFLWIGILLFSATMLIGVLGAVGEDRMRSILAFHMVSQIGYILLGVALFTPFGLTAGIAYLLHHMIVKASLFLSTGAIEERFGTDKLSELKGRIGKEPVLAVAFGAAAMSLAGLPPFSGFIAKFSLITSTFEAGQIAAAVVALLVSLITLQSMLKIFNGVFSPTIKGHPAPAEPSATAVLPGATPLALAAPALALAAVTLTLGLGAQGLLSLSEVAAAGLYDTSAYVEAVLP
ncbi:monovalent cation/H+ antiporter subunit D family protein [Brachybacterium aquaticum]|uniref:Multicomponent Na+:H+ antiporter subunit D n=1 Tax=Brachybacterium aquaticum TaxID=1432564 RepID=A0A841AGR7_9MICO|nr:monovalent cation/H+ antiporter subunit D family protein [Brachybacterium aquaticum]MBB5833127.1 multicomponent Na+:H+ antiporter subunit D [Brachybacterium aquaticum]